MKGSQVSLGKHVLVELFGCPAHLLNDVSYVQSALETAAEVSGATLINSTFHHFAPIGVSGVVVIQESHLAIHTWPEYGFAAIDLFTCGDTVNPWKAFEALKAAYQAKEGTTREVSRGGPATLLAYQEVAAQPPSIPEPAREAWFTERREHLALSLKHRGAKLFEVQSDLQKIEVIDTTGYGAALVLNGEVVMTQADSPAYHEMLVHVPLHEAGATPKDVLVLGGGDGGAAREILRYPTASSVVVIEHDPQIVEAGKVAFPELTAALAHESVTVLYEDANLFLNNAPAQSFDAVIVDLSLSATEDHSSFWKGIQRVLTPKGTVVAQSDSPQVRPQVLMGIMQALQTHWPKWQVRPYLTYLPSYPTGMWSFIMATPNSLAPGNSTSIDHLHYYNEEVHAAAFALPTFVRQLLPL